MSLTSKSTLSLKKKDVQQQKKAGTAYRRLVFAHKATAGETGVTFTSLVQPSEMAALGFTNPSSSDILAANILFYKKNLTVISSARGVLMQDLSYTIPTSSRIEFQGFTSLQDEIFTCLLETGVKDGLNVVDASPIVATGVLGIGITTFNVGTPFEVNKFPASQIGSVLVFRNGQIQFRNTGNGLTGGSYREINNGSGLGVSIQFNTAPVSPENVVVWGHHLAERPEGSMTAAIESLAGQIDQMIPTLAALAGVPTTTFQAAPNNQDLKAFGDKVEALLNAQILKSVPVADFIPTYTNFALGNGTHSWKYRRMGEFAIINGTITLGSTSSFTGNFLFSLPPTLVSDSTKLPFAYARVGSAQVFDVVPPDQEREIFQVFISGSGSSNLGISGRSINGGGTTGTINATFPVTFATGDMIHVYNVMVPIVGWNTTESLRTQLGL